ncbi:MAG: fused MFS/spermidine synthase [Myxococcales bacterium]|nr:fused MFS/spermidine synthase [Myxococcales bacterium]
MRRVWILPLLLLSGFSGLAYELLWVRLLTLSLGATTASFSIVLAVFFGGLALGARWAGKRSVGARRPLATYAALEALTGVLGLALYPVLKHLGVVVATIDPGSGGGAMLVRVVVSAVLLLPPTFLMGATLPFISVGTIERDDATGPGTALIYGLNTLGACLGAFFVTFVMLPRLGIFASTMLTASVNLTVAAIAFGLSRRIGGDGAAAPAPEDTEAPVVTDQRRRLAVIGAAGLGGLVATGAQVVWARLFTISLRGTSYGVGSVLVAVLIGIAIGSLIASAVSRRVKHVATAAVVFQLLFLIGLMLFAASTPLMNWVVGTLGNAGLVGTGRHLAELVAVLAFLALPTLAAGAVLPSLVAVAEGSARNAGKTLGELYSANTLGCIVGSLLTGFILLPGIGSSATLYLVVLLLAATTVVFAVATCADRRPVVVAATLVSLVAAAFFPQTDPRLLSPRTNASDYFSFLAAQRNALTTITSFYEGDVATVTVVKSGDSIGLSLNGLGQGSRSAFAPSVAHESALVGTTPWLHARHQRRGLVVGLGAGGTVDVLLKLGVERLEVAELERGVVDAVEEIWSDASPLKDPRVTLINNDARHHLLTASRRSPGSYDLITSMPAHPWVAAALFTREFFELARENLADGGVFSTWFGPAEMPDESIEGLFGAFASVFPYTLTYWVPEAGAFYLVGSRQPLTFDVAKADSLIGHPVMAGRSRDQARALFMASRVTAVTTPERPATARLISTDDNGLIEFGAQRPRTSGVLASLTYLPVRALPASMIVNTEPTPFALEVLENALGTRGGWLPYGGADGPAALRATSAIEPASSLHSYAVFRATLAQGKRPEAVTLAAAITEPVLAARARAYLAWTDGDKAARVAGLAPHHARPDVRAMLISLGEPDEPTPLGEPSTDDDPIGWLFVEPESLRGLDGEARARVSRTLTQRVAAFESPELARRAQRLFAAAGWTESAAWAASLVLDMERAASGVLVKRALEAGAKERYADAVRLLLDAGRIAPLREPQVRALLQAALRLEDGAAIKAARDMLLMRGLEPATVDGIESTLRAANSKEGAARSP